MNTAVIEQVYKFKGLSTETKPDCNSKGSVFEETDTGKTYRFDGTAWVEVEEDSGGGGSSIYVFKLDYDPDLGRSSIPEDFSFDDMDEAYEAGVPMIAVAPGNDYIETAPIIYDAYSKEAYFQTISINASGGSPIVTIVQHTIYLNGTTPTLLTASYYFTATAS